jgi:preprotein translocase subunit SecG|tara:strand:+ start:209 stop:532 length:324 start_codon:yes stop_codon:yes gene_type:complete
MTEVLLSIHLMIAAALVVIILLQRSEGGGLGIGGGGGGGGGMGGFMSARGTANLLTRATAILATCFFTTSLTLAIIADSGRKNSIADEIRAEETPSIPKAPQAPVSK